MTKVHTINKSFMKKRYAMTVVMLFILFSFTSSAQNTGQKGQNDYRKQTVNDLDHLHNCGTDDLHKKLMRERPDFALKHAQMEERIRMQTLQYLSGPQRGDRGTVYTIPTVIHVMHLPGTPVGTDENITDVQIIQGMQDLNDAFRNVSVFDSTTGADVEIEFCLAVRDPLGNPATGITRTATALSNLDNTVDDLNLKNLDRWNPNSYMNIWLVKEICSGGSCGVAGYAFFPSAHGQPQDGIVDEASHFGSSPNGSKVHIHEVGHYLNLHHTFEGGCPNNDCLAQGDMVCDTPPDSAATALFVCFPENTCNTDEDDVTLNNPFRPIAIGGLGDQNDMFENYMDYSPKSCKDRFTEGQKTRMRIALIFERASLLSSQGCLLVASFTADYDTVFLSGGGTVQFTNNSAGASSYSWDFGDGDTSNATSPAHTYMSEGTYTVRLAATDGINEDTAFLDVLVVDDVTAVDPNEFKARFDIYPNPSANGLFNLELELSGSSDIMIDVYNILGESVANIQRDNVTRLLVNFDLVNEPPGTYFVRCMMESEVIVKKIISY